MSSFIKDSLSLGLSKFSIILFSLLTSVITARSLGPEKNGIIASLLVYPSIFLSFGSLGVRQSTTYLLGQKIYSENQLKLAITQVWFITSLISLIICYLLIKNFGKHGDDDLFVTLAIIQIPFVLFNTYNSGIFLGNNDIKTFNKINWIPTAVVFLLTLILLIIFKLGIIGYLIALVSGPLTISLILLFKNKFIQSFNLNFQWSIIKSLLGLGMIYAFSLLIINLNYKFDVIMLERFSSSYETGIYTKGATITEFLWHIPMLLSTIVFARSASSQDNFAFSLKVIQLLRVSIILIGFGSIFLWFFSDIIIVGLFGSEFFHSTAVLNMLLPGVLLLTVYKVLNMDLAGKGKPWLAIYAMLPAFMVNVLLNYFWIPTYGAIGAAFASSVSYTLAAILFVFIYSKSVGISIRDIFSFSLTDFSPLMKFIIKKKTI